MSAKSASLEPQPCRQRNSGRRGAALPPPREYCTCVTCSGSPNLPGTTCDSRPIRPVGVFGLLESWESLVSCSRISLMPPIYPFQRGNPPSHWKDWDVGRLASGVIVPVSGGFWTLSELPAGGFSHWLEESGLWMACKRDDCASGWRFWDVGRLAGGQMFPLAGGIHPLKAKKKPRWRENHRGEKGERRRKGSIVGNCCGFLVGSFADISYINRRC